MVFCAVSCCSVSIDRCPTFPEGFPATIAVVEAVAVAEPVGHELSIDFDVLSAVSTDGQKRRVSGFLEPGSSTSVLTSIFFPMGFAGDDKASADSVAFEFASPDALPVLLAFTEGDEIEKYLVFLSPLAAGFHSMLLLLALMRTPSISRIVDRDLEGPMNHR
jgi:hypothetical protein